ncbi:uncharacterized protein Rsph1 [Chironomus tepperi]|uniref:uncharacterized protein Rsph1 n=1 Tax=Chironomus tepperi TaxID=113505 RepID=UPI00391F5BEA
MSIQDSEFEDDLDEILIKEIYRGEYVGDRLEDGRRDGFGRAILPNRDQYEGEYRHGLRNGSGCYYFNNGARYNGEWRKGSKDGHGKFNYPDGSSYCGLWKDGKKHGYGKYIYQNNDEYEGSWRHNIRHGIGTYKSHESGISFRATWIDGAPQGPIEIFYPNFQYHGYWNKVHPVGEGAFTFGTKYMMSGYIEMLKNVDNVDSVKASNEMLDVKTQSSSQDNLEQEVNDENVESNNENLTNVKFPKCLPHFIAHDITQYDYSHLPQHPIPPPETDSEISICTKSSSSGVDEVHLYQVHSPILVSLDFNQYCNEDENEDAMDENEINCVDESEGHEGNE